MPLAWFSGSKEASLDELIAAKKYKKAIELLLKQFKDGSRDPRLRLMLADLLVLAGRPKEAVPILGGLADEYARAGFAAKAIAVLKKLQKAAPGNPDVEKRLARLLHDKIGGGGGIGLIPPPPRPAADASAPFGMEEIGSDAGEIGIGDGFAPVSAPHAPSEPAPAVGAEAAPLAAAPAAAPAPAAPAPAAAARPPAEVELLLSADPIAEDEFAGLLDDLVDGTPVEEEPLDAKEPAAAAPAAPQNSLFGAFSEAELQAVIHRFQLLSFAPGDIVVSEGQPGDSLFVLTTGTLKAFVRDQSQRNVALRELPEGSFFGEVSILTGQPRSATITCASACELLELDRAALDEIVAQYPRVRELIRATGEARRGSLEEMLAREGGSAEGQAKPGSGAPPAG